MKRFLKIAAFAALLFSTDFATAQSKVEDYPTIQFFAHRGSRFEYDENTMKAFKEAYARGARGFETDVRMTGDGDLILSHDESLYRTCGVDVQTEDLTTKQCLKIKTKAGNDLALCQELADFLADKENMYIEWEIKTIPELYTQAMLDDLCEKLWNMTMTQKPASSLYLFTSFDKRALNTMKRLHPEAEMMLLKSKPASPEILMEAYNMGIMRVGCKMDGTTRSTIRLGHKLGMIVSLWPGNNKEDFFLGAALGCDAMCCDRFFEVGDWAEKNLPFVKIKGYEKPQK
ncbi:MAG: glycerophosphodiester phosphodiesterase [Alistipes sp.]|nr:glycerophosphodiester phosphodiesterase [Alistipes sp.]